MPLASLILVAAVAATSGPPGSADLVPGVAFIAGAWVPGRQPDGNSVVFTGPGGVVVVDTGRHPAHAARIAAAVRASGRPLRAIVNTHWHLDHVAGNPALRAEWPRATVHASDAIDPALAGFLARYRRSLFAMLADGASDDAAREGYRAEIARIDAGPALRPDRVVDGPRTLRAGGVRLDLHLARHAATAGDVWAYEPVGRVLAAGDLVTLPAPLLDTACPAGWRSALDAIEATPFQVLVPGHGGPFDRAQFRAWRAAFDALLDCTAGDAADATCVAAWVDATRALPGAGDAAFARQVADYYVAQRLRGAARTADCPPAR